MEEKEVVVLVLLVLLVMLVILASLQVAAGVARLFKPRPKNMTLPDETSPTLAEGCLWP
jgi:hypothetical protein